MRTRCGKALAAGLVVIAALSASACREVEEETAAGYEPSTLSADQGQERGLQARHVHQGGRGADRPSNRRGPAERPPRTVVPYTALIYNDEAKTFVYTSPKPLSFVRAPVSVDRIEGDRVLLSDGPPAGTKVVTVGATEVYGAELEIAGAIDGTGR